MTETEGFLNRVWSWFELPEILARHNQLLEQIVSNQEGLDARAATLEAQFSEVTAKLSDLTAEIQALKDAAPAELDFTALDAALGAVTDAVPTPVDTEPPVDPEAPPVVDPPVDPTAAV